MTERNKTIARVGFATFIDVMVKASVMLSMNFKVTDKDDDQITFDLDGYVFTLSWEEKLNHMIGGHKHIVRYTLSAWHIANMYDRDSPPENVDVMLLVNQSIYPCIEKAFQTVYNGKIHGVMENIGEMQRIEEEKKAEW